MFPVWDANASRADIEMAMLVVAAVWCGGVEVEFDIHCIGREKVVVVVSVRCVCGGAEVADAIAGNVG